MLSTQLIVQALISTVAAAAGVLTVRAANLRSGRPETGLGALWTVVGGMPVLVIGFATMERLGGGGGAVIGKGLIAAAAAGGFLGGVALKRITGNLRTAVAAGSTAPGAALAGAGVEMVWNALHIGVFPRWPVETAMTLVAGGLFVVALAVVLWIWVQRERLDNVYKHDHCVFCRYDVSGVRSHLCPECGRQHHARRPTSFSGPNGTQGAST